MAENDETVTSDAAVEPTEAPKEAAKEEAPKPVEKEIVWVLKTDPPKSISIGMHPVIHLPDDPRVPFKTEHADRIVNSYGGFKYYVDKGGSK